MSAPSKPACHEADALAVLQRLRASGHEAYFAGGCVRDMRLGLTPADFDIATDAPPPRVRQLFPQTQAVGAAFGVILVRHGRSTIEVATFRADGAYSDGRRPDSVRFSSAPEDARRRDFTINGLFFDPVEQRLIDWVGGESDLRDRVLRAIGDPAARFAEDHLRLLRAIRFAARFDLVIESKTAAAIDNAAPLLITVSPERLADELRRMLTVPTRARAWKLLWQHRLGAVIFRLLPKPVPTTLDLDRSLFLAVSPEEPISFPLALAAAVLEVQTGHVQAGQVRAGQGQARQQAGNVEAGATPDLRTLLEKRTVQTPVQAMRTALKLSNDETDAVRETLLSLAPLLGDDPPRVAVMKRFLAQPTSPDARRLLRAIASRGGYADRIQQLTTDLAQLSTQEVAPPPLVTGDDLTAAGLPPGPLFKRLLDQLYDDQLEGRLASTAQGVERAQSLAQEQKNTCS